jgi:alkylhydroperoxidase family enzyme
LTQQATADDSRAAMREHYSDEQIVEITLVAAMANFTNRFNNGLQIVPEA